MTETISDIGDEIKVCAFRPSELTVNRLDDGLYDVNVFPLVESADVVCFGDCALVKNQLDCPCVILHIEPVADILALAIDRKWFAMADIVDKERNKLLGKLIRAVVIRAVRHDAWHPICIVICTNKVVAACLGSRIRRMRVVLRGLVEEVLAVRQMMLIRAGLGRKRWLDAFRVRHLKRTINFIRRDMIEDFSGRDSQYSFAA